MPEEKPAPAGSGRAATGYSYPGDIARFVRDRWPDALGPAGDPLPDAAALEGFFEACYQASMLREEERPIVFRAVLAEPEEKQACKKDGWKGFGFKNQGQCIKAVNHAG
jgi:hypothetical protein